MAHCRFRGDWVVMAGVLLLAAGSRARAQVVSPPFSTPQPTAGSSNTPYGEPPGRNPALEQKQAALQNNDRQRRLVADTDKLLALATQLHADVAKTDKNILSIDVVKRAEEIERLAKSVKDRMKG